MWNNKYGPRKPIGVITYTCRILNSTMLEKCASGKGVTVHNMQLYYKPFIYYAVNS